MVQAANPQNGARSSAETDLFDLALVGHALLFAVRSLFRHPILATSTFLLVVAAAGAGLAVFPQRYEVSTTILAGSPLTGALSVDARDRDPTRAARELLLGRENLEALVERLGLADRYLEKRPPALRTFHRIIDAISGIERNREMVAESMVDTLAARLQVEAWSGDTVTIRFQWWDAEIAYEVVQAAAESYLEMRKAAEIKTIGESIAILREHRQSLERQINERLAALEAREKAEKEQKRSVPRARVAVQDSGADIELARLQSALAASQRAAADFEAVRQQRIAELQAQLLQQETIYAPDHPAIAATRRMLDTLQQPSGRLAELRAEVKRLQDEIDRRRADIRPSVGVAPAGEASDPLSLLFEQDPREAYEMDQLRSLRTQLAEVDYRIASSHLEMETAEAAFKHRYAFLSPPRIPKGPAKPYAQMFLAGGIAGGALLALLAAVVADLRSGRILERWQIEHALGVPVLVDRRR